MKILQLWLEILLEYIICHVDDRLRVCVCVIKIKKEPTCVEENKVDLELSMYYVTIIAVCTK